MNPCASGQTLIARYFIDCLYPEELEEESIRVKYCRLLVK